MIYERTEDKSEGKWIFWTSSILEGKISKDWTTNSTALEGLSIKYLNSSGLQIKVFKLPHKTWTVTNF